MSSADDCSLRQFAELQDRLRTAGLQGRSQIKWALLLASGRVLLLVGEGAEAREKIVEL